MSGACRSAFDTLDVKIWEVKVGGKYFIDNRDEARTVSFPHPKAYCNVCYDDSGLRMHCGHFICPDDLLDWTWKQIKNSKHQINCPACPSIISMEDILKFGLPNTDEKQFLNAAISVNFCESQDTQQCPGCQTYCQRIQTDSPQVICIVCTRKMKKNNIFCWSCLKWWNNPGSYQDCGNPDCKSSKFQQLQNCEKKIFRDALGKMIFTPEVRACPKCFTILEHKSGCNEMTCKCGERFCFICLTKTTEGSLICRGRTYETLTCTPAPVQTKFS